MKWVPWNKPKVEISALVANLMERRFHFSDQISPSRSEPMRGWLLYYLPETMDAEMEHCEEECRKRLPLLVDKLKVEDLRMLGMSADRIRGLLLADGALDHVCSQLGKYEETWTSNFVRGPLEDVKDIKARYDQVLAAKRFLHDDLISALKDLEHYPAISEREKMTDAERGKITLMRQRHLRSLREAEADGHLGVFESLAEKRRWYPHDLPTPDTTTIACALKESLRRIANGLEAECPLAFSTKSWRAKRSAPLPQTPRMQAR